MKKVLFVAVFAAPLILGQVGGQQQYPADVEPFPNLEARPFNLWMDVKLEEAQAILAALSRADYAAIDKSGRVLKTMNGLEGFVRGKTPGYSTQLKVFEFAVDEILQQAQQKNIEGVTLGFQQLTLSCVNCHKQLRPAGEAQK